AMLDGQIENIAQVAAAARVVVGRLEKKTRVHLSKVCVAAAGRALKSESASFGMELSSTRQLTDEDIGHLEAGAVSAAEQAIMEQAGEQQSDQYYMVGYTVTTYRLDGYPMSSIKDHSGKLLEADVVATFLPREVVDSLYAVVGKMGLEVASLTLEPIASLNAAIPTDIRLLNLVLVDIGAGTSDIAVCRDGSVVGYTMATVAGDEVTELLMRSLLVDFQTGEQLKMALGKEEPVHYTDILGLTHEMPVQELRDLVAPTADGLAQELAKRILDLNGRLPSAVFLAGGGSKLNSLREKMAAALKIDPVRVTAAGNHFERNAYAEEYNLNDPEYATPLGIAISAGLGLINDSYIILLNGTPAKLFRSGILLVRDILMMNGYNYADLMGKTGANLTVTLNGERKFYRGALPIPPIILINGEPASITDTVRAGDSIQFTPARSGADAARRLRDLLGSDFTGSVSLNGAAASLDDYVNNGDDIWVTEAAPSVGADSGAPANPSGGPAGGTASAGTGVLGPSLRVFLNGERLELPGKEGGDVYYLVDMLPYSKLDFDHLEKPVELLVNGERGQFSQKLNENDQVIIR
ncbi:MAG: rod shape-determining protein, partial [Oscillibacter sp.]|nr:rod shape-determining protein [Oscillibacter sp.]